MRASLLGAISFDFCAQCVKSFIKEHFGIDENSPEKKDLVMGFTVSRAPPSSLRSPALRSTPADIVFRRIHLSSLTLARESTRHKIRTSSLWLTRLPRAPTVL